jgi:hypothetical protein
MPTLIGAILFSGSCAARNQVSVCYLPSAAVRFYERDGGREMEVELENQSPATIQFESRALSPESNNLEAIRSEGGRLNRVVTSETPGFENIVLRQGERRMWLYKLRFAFPDLEQSLGKSDVELHWALELTPVESSCSLEISGTEIFAADS